MKSVNTYRNRHMNIENQNIASPVDEMNEVLNAGRYREIIDGAAYEFEQKMDSYFTDPDIREFIASLAVDRGVVIPDILGDISEDEFMDAAQVVLDSRKGQGRESIVDSPYSERSKEALEIVKVNLQMNHNSEPSHTDFDIAFVPGSAGKSPANRLKYLLKLIEAGSVKTDTIAMLGCERPVDTKPNKAGTTELDRAGIFGYDKSGNPAVTEFDLMRNSATHLLDIADEDWQVFEGHVGSIPEQHRFQYKYKIAYAEKNGKQVFVLSTPMLDEQRLHPDGNYRNRANTKDNVRMSAEMLRDHAGSSDELNAFFVTDAIFAKFQEADLASVLAPYGVRLEAAGFSRKEADASDWPGGNNYYAQELLSTLRQTRDARNMLRQERAKAHAA